MADPTIRIDHDIDNSNVFTKPTGLTNGDVWVIRYAAFQNNTTLPGDPAGWTKVYSTAMTHAAGDCLLGAMWYKVITNAAGEANVTISRGGSVFWDGGNSCAVQDANSGDEIDDSGGNSGTSTAPSTGANITTTNNGALILVGSVTYGQNCSTPSGMTQDYELDGGDTEGWHESLTGSTVTGATRSSTIGASVEWVYGFIAIKAAAGAAAGQPTSKRFGGVPFMGAHGSGFPSAVRRWIKRDSGLSVPTWRLPNGIN